MSALLDPITQYALLMAITLIFTILALTRESITLYLLSAFCWFVSALGHLMIGSQTSPLTIGLAILYSGFGILFSIRTVEESLSYLSEKRKSLDV